jgi:hypothetical protein
VFPHSVVSTVCRPAAPRRSISAARSWSKIVLWSVFPPGTDSRVTTAVGMKSLAAKALFPIVNRMIAESSIDCALPSGRLRNPQLRLARCLRPDRGQRR